MLPVFFSQPIHLSTHLSRIGFNSTYESGYIPKGGVIALTPAAYRKINGFSNMFWGWGGEDDDFFQRMSNGGNIERHNASNGR